MAGILYPLIWVILRLITSKRRIKLIQRIRNDVRGSGGFGSTRVHGTHNGIDIITTEGEEIYAPMTMYVERESKANNSTKTSGIRFVPRDISDGTHGYIWYFEPYDENLGEWVTEGEPLGRAQDIKGEYSAGMINHVHIEQWAGAKPINIESTYV
jgi:hypothetical protein